MPEPYHNPEQEVRSGRTLKSKCYDIGSGNKKFVCRTYPIHFKSEIGKGENPSIEEFEDIDVELELVDAPSGASYDEMYLTPKHQHTVGFRSDGSLTKYKGIRLYESDGVHQIEFSFHQLKLNDTTIQLLSNFHSQELSGSREIVYTFSEALPIEYHTQVHEKFVRDWLRVENATDIGIVEKIELTGYEIENTYTTSGSTKTYIEGEGLKKFTFKSITESDKIVFIPHPMMWSDNEESISMDVAHKLEEIDGILYYTKYLPQEGKDWLLEQSGYINFDGTQYTMDSTNDDGILTETYIHPVQLDSWNGARNQTDCDFVLTTGGYDNVHTKQTVDKVNYVTEIVRACMLFDTSGIDDDADIIEVELGIYVVGQTASRYVHVLEGTQGETIDTIDFDNFDTDYAEYTSHSINSYNTLVLGSNANRDVVKTGNTPIFLREDYRDVDNNVYPGTTSEQVMWKSDNSLADKPYLEITVTLGLSDCNNPGEIALNTTVSGSDLYVETEIESSNDIRQYSICA